MIYNKKTISEDIIIEFFSLIKLNKSSDLLFDNEYQDSGIYNPELTEPDYTNAQNSALWKLHTLRVLLEFIRLFFNRI